MYIMKRYGRFFILTLLILILTTTTGLRAEVVRQAISGEMPANGDVSEMTLFQITPDGQYVVFIADKGSDETFDLFSAPVDGSAKPIKLSNALNGTAVTKFAIDNQNRVVYMAQEDNSGVVELYRTHMDGTGHEKVNPVFTDGGLVVLDRDVTDFLISPVNGRIVYTADYDTNATSELYSVKIAGTHTKLNAPLVADGDVSAFKISLDGSRVIYIADQDVNQQSELYTVPIGGGAVNKLNFPMVANGDVTEFDIANEYVVYLADEDIDQTFELYRVPVADGIRTKLHPDFAGDQDVSNFALHAGSAGSEDYVVYRANQDAVDMLELYSVHLPNSATNTKLNDTLSITGNVYGYQISPNGKYVVYLADQTTADVIELYSVPIGGGTPLKRNGPLGNGGDVFDFTIAPNSSRIVYRADQDIDKQYELYSVAIVAINATAVKLNDTLPAGGNVEHGFLISPENDRALYMADALVDEQFDLFTVPLTGGTVQQVNKLITASLGGRDVTHFQITPDGRHVIYRADETTDQTFELFTVSETEPTVQFSSSSLSVDETAVSAELTVTLSAASFAESSVEFTVSGGTATNGADYDLAGDTLGFPAGSTSQTISIPIKDDALTEANETIIISLSAPTNAKLNAQDTITITIIDDDSGGTGDADGYTLYLPMVTR